MTSRFNTETMTMRRMGKTNQKTTNISTSKRYAGTKSKINNLLFISKS